MKRGLDGPTPEERPTPAGRRNKQGIRIDPEVEAKREPRRTVISALVEHEPGVLSDVSGLFSRRQFNIESLTVGPTEDEDENRARITVVVEEPDPGIDQIKKQLRKLVPVIAVRELEPDAMRRELALIKVNAERPDQVAAVADMYGAKTVDSSPESATFEVTGARQKIDAAIETFTQFGIREISRTGLTALARGTDDTAAASSTVSTADEANQQPNAQPQTDD
ncbi:acetolactate synthase small subunit [Natronorubrum daqingense]|uniref:Acetolactate synthase small subunit n=1 Tax=Natronorubrum daqingense TaxID=588898 RepID=A0A1N7CC27_9EURY|nr:acetolactate synthase small subunit [Natronorubrum daqingense]APX96834.1 acetolactate synthase small subunit [Natronorubrum daqingense]SIR61155.1 acetolactate synthase, small subunit [Natronorubrum daqingense]